MPPLEGGRSEKSKKGEWRGSKDFENWQTGPRGGCLKKEGGGGWNPLTNYALLFKSFKYDKWKPILISESPILFKLL